MSLRIILKDPAAGWLEFTNPVELISAMRAADVMPALRDMENQVIDEGLWGAGYVTYEAAPGCDNACVTHSAGPLPLLQFGLFEPPKKLEKLEAAAVENEQAYRWTLDTTRDDYMHNVSRIRSEIAKGNTYQVNYTIRGRAASVVDPWQLFLAIAEGVPYAAYIETEGYAIVSASPELFFGLDGDQLVSRPMKGTAARGLSAHEDSKRRLALQTSAKDRAENVMIADMLRNDMGKVAEPGTVGVASLFDIEKYATVWQATSSISATTNKPVSEIFQALFPCASITGAPKIASMQLIAELEQTPRGVYTGAIGYLSPGRKAQFSVAIRTAYVDRTTNEAEYGVGGGIVWDSEPAAEYNECLTKGRILHRGKIPSDFDLLETILWTREESYYLLEQHIARLQSSADYFEFSIDPIQIRQKLAAFAKSFDGQHQRIRLLLKPSGAVTLRATGIEPAHCTRPARVRLATDAVDEDNVFLYHKTTNREVYERALSDADHCDDVLLWNSGGFVTESTIANVAVRIGGQLFTPPVSAGLLPGVYRESLLASGQLQERSIQKSDLERAEEIVLFNSVRKLYPAELQQSH